MHSGPISSHASKKKCFIFPLYYITYQMNSLPIEILPTILSFIDSTSHLASCRLVCRMWNSFAEDAMLSRRIDICRIEAAWAFYDYIVRNPSKGRLIKHLDMGEFNLATYELNRRLLRLIFTPNLETLSGEYCRPEFYDEMTRIAKETSTDFKKLTVIPHPSKFPSSYGNAAVLFKDTLQDLFVNISSNIFNTEHGFGYINQFKHLTSFAFSFYDTAFLGTVDKLLGALPQIKEIKFYVTANADDWEVVYRKEDIERLAENHTLKKLKISTGFSKIVHLLLAHFVALESLEVNFEPENKGLGVPQALMLELETVPSFEFTFTVLKSEFMNKEQIQDVFGKCASITSASRLETDMFGDDRFLLVFGYRIEDNDNGTYLVKVKR